MPLFLISRSRTHLLFVLLCACFLQFTDCAAAATPPPPRWPSQWHADVVVSDIGIEPLAQQGLPVTHSGHYYYDSVNNASTYVCEEVTSGRGVRDVSRTVGGSTVLYQIDGPTGQCQVAEVLLASRFMLLRPDFVTSLGLAFVGVEYYLEDGVYFETHHWSTPPSSPPDPLAQIDYWHSTELEAPFRISFGDLNPALVQFRRPHASFDDLLPQAVKQVFSVPSQCSSSSSSSTSIGPDRQRPISRRSLAGALMSSAEIAGRNREITASGQGYPWPGQWHGRSAFTGNNFGLGLDALPLDRLHSLLDIDPATALAIGEPTLVPVSLRGHYYYDEAGQRECNEWVDTTTGERTKTLIVGGKFHLVYQATNSCLIVPTGPVGGPLKHAWPSHLPYVDDQWLRIPPSSQGGEAAFVRAHHYRLDALGIGDEHAFHYWETADSRSPLQFQGPVLEFYPYGQSMSYWSETVIGLDGVDLDSVFSLPPNCHSPIPSATRLPLPLPLPPQVLLHLVLARRRAP